MSRRARRAVSIPLFLMLIAAASQLSALQGPEKSGVGEKQLRHPDLDIHQGFEPAGRLPARAADRAHQDIEALGAAAANARIDRRSNRFAVLTPSHPLIPGRGNRLAWNQLGTTAPGDRGGLARATRQAFAGYLAAHAPRLRIDAGEAEVQLVTAISANVVQIYVPRIVGGVPVRGSYLSAVVNNGNVALLGTTNWGDVDVDLKPSVALDQATSVVGRFVAPHTATGFWGKGELTLVPMAKGGQDVDKVPLGRGLSHRLAWSIKPAFKGEHGHWEALVDAHSGEILAFEDQNHYAEVKGGVLPVTNDGIVPDGVEQPGWPMPFDNVTTTAGTVTSDSGGNFTAAAGNRTSNLSGQFIRMNDNCGAISLTTTGDLEFGTSGGTDCTTPGFGGAGNTHASRTGFHELNRMKEMARGQLPGNTWLQQQLTSNMNINQTCNAFWGGGTVNFYRSGGGCFNTGEIAGVFDHEFGHGLDDNDAVPTIASPSGEGIADVYTALRLNDSCIGRNFRATVCTGFGDPCLTCTGVRDIDYLKRASGEPHDYSWSNANCGGSVHCVGSVYSEAVWSLWKRELQQAPYNYDNNTAHEIVTRLTYIGAGATGTWFSGGPPNGGCAGTSGYMNYLAADDDNGNLNDGTPHMQAIFNAFNDQEIACGTPTVQDAGCAGTPSVAPSVTGTPFDKAASLSWGAVTGASSYEVFRTDGVFACDFGKIRLGETTGTTWNDSGLQNGRDYSYVVIPKGSAAACFGPASSCTPVTPAAGPNLDVDAASAALAILTGDGDAFLDNCEDGSLTFDVHNTGLGSLTNVRIVSVTATSHPSTTINTSFPAAVSPATLGEGGTGSGSFSFTAGGLAFNDTLTFQVEVTADELVASKTGDLSVGSAESDFVTYASRTFSFETDLEDWVTTQGIFNRSSALGGGDATSWAVESSNGLHNQCDRVRSPILRLQSTSTMAMWNNFDIEPFSASTWYDRANVGVIDDGGARSLITPDGGRLYNANSAGPGNYSGCNNPEEGWAGAAATWASSSWSQAALQSGTFAGQPVQLEVVYGTDPALANRGFSFDQVTVTDVDFQEADGQSDVCSAGCTLNSECDDGLFCNGAETCNAGTCQAGTPVACDDGVACTDDSCNEGTDSCDNLANNANCDNGLFCDGAETCDVALDCQAGTPVDCNDLVGCTADSCNEGSDSCDNVPDDGACDNGVFCDGAETCDAINDCQSGTPPSCDDGVGCTDDSCNAGTDACGNVANDANCDNGQFCDGAETCDAVADCQAGSDPCPGQSCDEGGDLCVPSTCDFDGTCETGEDCNNCSSDCISGTSSGAVCGNGVCETADGEDCVTCAADCNGIQNGKPSGRFCCGNGGSSPVGCGDSRCFDGGLDCTTDPAPSGNYCCGDATCEGAEDSFTCEIDCGPAPFCGDTFCDAGEDQCSCAVDCGTPPGTEVAMCTDGVDNDCDVAVDCNDSDCAGDPACTCLPKNAFCSLDSECCSGDCKNNGRCR